MSSPRFSPGSQLGLGLAVFGGVSLMIAGLLVAAEWTVRRAPVFVDIGSATYSVSEEAVEVPIALGARRLESEPLYLVVSDEVVEAPRSIWGFGVDRARARAELTALIRRVRAAPEPASLRLRKALALWGGGPEGGQHIRYELPLELDEGQALPALRALAERIHRYPEDAELLIEEHRVVPSQMGRELSVEASLVRLRTEGPSDNWIELEVFETEPQVTETDLLPVDVTRVLATFETSFRGKAGPRAVNIRTAARFLNGAVILPGEVLSFNERVGRRIHGRGFVDAPVIVNDEMDEDVGGGVCQVATTLHAAAVYANLEVVERRSHSRPSGYAPLGLDATVIDGKVDLRLRNPYDEPLLVHAWVPEPYLMRVELLGRAPDVEVEHGYSVTHREPFVRRIWHKSEAPSQGFERKQKGSEGMDVVSVLRIRKDGQEIGRRRYFSKYYPVPEVFYVGEGARAAALPPLPEGAVGLVVDGQEMGALAQAEPARPPTIDESNGLTQDSTAGRERLEKAPPPSVRR